MKTKRAFFFSILLFFQGTILFCQSFNLPIFPKDYQEVVRIQFRMINNLIIIPISINNSDTMSFVLDSGVRTALITELSVGDSLSLNYTRQTQVNGLGQGEPVEALHSYGNTFSLGGIVFENFNIYVLMENIFELSNHLGIKVHGIIGFDVFKDIIVEIDYNTRILYLHNQKYYKYKKHKKAVEFPLEFVSHKPYIYTEIIQNDSSQINMKLLVDTGGSMALWLALGSDKRIIEPEKKLEAFLGRGLNGDINGFIGRISAIKIGQYILKSPVTSFPDSASVNSVIISDNRNGSLGAEALRRFRVIIDYPNSRITLKPNKNLKEKFTYNMSGIELFTPIPGLPIYEILNIHPNSPADQAGLKKGDQIVRLNYKPAYEYSYNDVNALFQSKAGKTIKIIVAREDGEFATKFILEDRL